MTDDFWACIEADQGFLPYWPLMLDMSELENGKELVYEEDTYREAFE